MDLVSILGAIATGALTGVVVAFAALQFQAAHERERWERDDAIRREEAERLASERWLADERRLCARFLQLIEGLREAARLVYNGETGVLWRTPWDEAHALCVEITLTAPPLGQLAEAVYEAGTALVGGAMEWAHDLRYEGIEPADHKPPLLEEREQPLNEAIESFMSGAQARLRPR